MVKGLVKEKVFRIRKCSTCMEKLEKGEIIFSIFGNGGYGYNVCPKCMAQEINRKI